MKNNKHKIKTLFLFAALCTFAIVAGTVTIIAQYATQNNNTKVTKQQIVNALENLIKNPISINTTLTANEALYANNEDAVNSSIKNAILKQLGQRINVDNTMISTQSLLNNISISLPKTVSYTNYINGELTNVNLSYDSTTLKPRNADSYTVINFQKPTSNNNINQNQIKDVANKLALIINNPIELIDYKYTVQQSLSSQENEQTLINAIKNAVEVNIIENGINHENSKESYLNINNILYSINEIMQNLTINLNHDFVISQEYNDGYLTGVTLFFHGLNNIQSQIETQTYKTYKIINFLRPTASDYETNDNHISNGLSNSVLTNGTITLPSN
ncbi:hypothetical protein IKS57_04000 [bacterium]|nr:hypothetical protein [bacterium]